MGALIAFLALGFLIVNIIPIPAVASSGFGGASPPCGNCPPPPPGGTANGVNTSLIFSSTEYALKIPNPINISFTISTNQPVNLTVIGAEAFVARLSLSEITASGTFASMLSLSPAKTNPGSYPIEVEALQYGMLVTSQEILIVAGLSNSSSSGGSGRTTTTTTSSSSATALSGGNSSNYYWGAIQSYHISINQELVGPDGSVVSSKRILSFWQNQATPTSTILQYNITISSVPASASGVRNPGPYFVYLYSLGDSQEISPVRTDASTGGMGWNLYQFSYSIPATGGSIVIDLNTTSLLYGEHNALADPNARGKLSSDWKGILGNIVAPQISGSAPFAASMIEITFPFANSTNGLATVLSMHDAVQLPIQTPIPSCPTGQVYAQGYCQGIYYQENGGGGGCIHYHFCFASLFPATNTVSIFGLDAVQGTSPFLINTSDLLVLFAVLSFALELVTLKKGL